MKFDARENAAGAEGGSRPGTEGKMTGGGESQAKAVAGAGAGPAVRKKPGLRGRPRLREPRRKLVALRMQLPLLNVLKSLADRQGISQGRVIELCLARYARELRS